jgi:hypothetical protein
MPISFNLNCVPDRPGTSILKCYTLVTIYLRVDYFTTLSVAKLASDDGWQMQEAAVT